MKQVLEVDGVCFAVDDLAEVHAIDLLADDAVLFFQDILLELQDLAEERGTALLRSQLV